jgi:hypothetical protein
MHALINNLEFNLSVTYRAKSFGFPRTTVLIIEQKLYQWRGAHRERERFNKAGIIRRTNTT